MPSSRSESLKAPQLSSDDLVPFDHVAAGHDGVRSTISGSLIVKPCTKQEVDFYEASALHPAFQEFMPLFIGSLSSADQQQPQAISAAHESGAIFLPAPGNPPNSSAGPDNPTSHPCLCHPRLRLPHGQKSLLENVAAGFRRPNVLDVKLGARLWADDAPPAKRSKLDAVSKETTSSILGYRIAGMKVWTGEGGETDEGTRTNPFETRHEGGEGAKGEVIEKNGYRRYDKWYGRSFNAQNVKQGFETFLAGAKAGPVDRSKMVAQRVANELKNLQEVLKSEESRMYSASVLVVYEGDPDAFEHALEEEKRISQEEDQEDAEDDGDDDDDEDEDENIEFEFSEEAMEVQLGDGKTQQVININIDSQNPAISQLPDLGDDEDEETPQISAGRGHNFRKWNHLQIAESHHVPTRALLGRSVWKGPNIVPIPLPRTLPPPPNTPPIRTQKRSATILPNFVGIRFAVHNGKTYQEVYITEEMVGRKLGEYVATRKRFTYKQSKNK
ncbi:arginine metabolism regulation protein iii [Penicillium chermesinum]|nr:arginine metabolism regulation protein iii [Penicillium chermesinum]